MTNGKFLASLVALLVPLAAGVAQAPSAGGQSVNDRLHGDLTPVHDPAIVSDGHDFYVFSTTSQPEPSGLIAIRQSTDLLAWKRVGSALPAMPAWAAHEIPGAKGIWAPDVSFSNGQYRLYYAVSTFGSNHSAIGLATSPTLDPAAPGYGWTDRGPVIVSHAKDDFNAIDPNAFTDRDGKTWLAFGSFWTGLKLIRLDQATGKRSVDDNTIYPLAQRAAPGAVEASALLDHDGYYYLFASYDFCCRGAASTYYEIVGRSKEVTGPYLDHSGKPLMNGFGEVVLHGQLDKTGRWRGPGGASILRVGDHAFLAYHSYDAQHGGAPTLRIAPLGWTADGWPVARL